MTYLYRHYDKDGVLLYVGIASSVLSRTAAHMTEAAWFPLVDTITFSRSKDRGAAFKEELTAIHDESPLFNLVGNPDRNLAYKRRVFAKAYAKQCKNNGAWLDSRAMLREIALNEIECSQPARVKLKRKKAPTILGFNEFCKSHEIVPVGSTIHPKNMPCSFFEPKTKQSTAIVHESDANSHLEETKPEPKTPFIFRKYVLEVLTAIVVVVVYSWHIYLLVAY